jgi:hypothetical protein
MNTEWLKKLDAQITSPQWRRSVIYAAEIGKCPRKLVAAYYAMQQNGNKLCTRDQMAEAVRRWVVYKLYDPGIIVIEENEMSVGGDHFLVSVDASIPAESTGILVKTVSLDAHLEHEKGMPMAWLYHAQSVIHYMKYNVVIVVVVSRESGRIKVIPVTPSAGIIKRIEAKVVTVQAAIDKKELPMCECGRC